MRSMEKTGETEKAELINNITELQRRLGQAVHSDTPEPWLALNLTIAQLKSLFFINFEGTSNSKMLAKALNVTPPNVTGIIDRLVEQDLVSREENPDNRRMQVLKVTEKGAVLLRELNERGMNRFSNILTKLSMEDLSALDIGLTSLVRAAETIKENIKDEYDRS
jgi:DNA-binding MarR family transcriptional regulator